jgi:hypothetical protein
MHVLFDQTDCNASPANFDNNLECAVDGARPRLGSSSSNNLGATISPLAIASICCSPPDKEPARTFRRSRPGIQQDQRQSGQAVNRFSNRNGKRKGLIGKHLPA